MTKNQIILLSSIKEEDHFLKILDSISTQYYSQNKDYDSIIKSMKYNEGHSNIPKFLYKFLPFEGGLSSIINTNIQFSHPLSFRNNTLLGDMTEFWFDRFYIDHTSLLKYVDELEQKFDKRISIMEAYTLFLYQTVMNTVERNKVLCLSTELANNHLWGIHKSGICIEYYSDLFRNKENFIDIESNTSIIYNEVKYVDKIIPYPIRFDCHDWLSNYLFIKLKNNFELEKEYRIIYTKDYIDNYSKANREHKRQYAYNRIFDKDMGVINPDRLKFNREFINHVYYSQFILNEDKLLKTLNDYNISYSKLII